MPSAAPPHSALGLGAGGRRACSCHSPREQPLLNPPPQTRSSNLPPPHFLPPLCHQLLSRAVPGCSFQLCHILASACHLVLGQCPAACPSPGHPVRCHTPVGCGHVLPAAAEGPALPLGCHLHAPASGRLQGSALMFLRGLQCCGLLMKCQSTVEELQQGRCLVPSLQSCTAAEVGRELRR